MTQLLYIFILFIVAHCIFIVVCISRNMRIAENGTAINATLVKRVGSKTGAVTYVFEFDYYGRTITKHCQSYLSILRLTEGEKLNIIFLPDGESKECAIEGYNYKQHFFLSMILDFIAFIIILVCLGIDRFFR